VLNSRRLILAHLWLAFAVFGIAIVLGGCQMLIRSPLRAWISDPESVTAIAPVSLGRATVLYTFYPPLIGSPFYYIGLVLVVVGSWIWVALMAINLRAWKKANPGRPVPLAMFANVAGSYLWAWTAVGAALELLFQLIPVALGLSSTINAGLARVLFSWTLHAIVYFWLIRLISPTTRSCLGRSAARSTAT
jgi:cytochrome c oxidase subunit I